METGKRIKGVVDLEKMLGSNANPDNRQEPAWAKLGNTFDERGLRNGREAMVQAELDYEVRKVPMLLDFGDGKVAPVDGTQRALVRMPYGDHHLSTLGFVTDDYKVVDNKELMDAIQPITDKYPLISLGAFNDGARFWGAIDAGDGEVGKDLVKKYFVFQDWKNGKGSSSMVLTPLRPVCQNTLNLSLKIASVRFDVPHRGNNVMDLKFVAALMNEIELAGEKTLQLFRQMAKAQLDQPEIEAVFEAAYPYPKRPRRAAVAEQYSLQDLTNLGLGDYGDQFAASSNSLGKWDYHKKLIDGYRQTSRLLLERFNDEHSWAANTAWAAYNAVTENSDWRRGSKTGIAESVLFGYRAQEKVRGFEAVLEQAEINAN